MSGDSNLNTRLQIECNLLNAIFFVTDFNTPQTSNFCRESGCAYRETGVRSINGASAIAYIPTVRSEISKSISNAHVFTSRSVPLSGLRTTDLPRESARPPSQTLSLGHPRQYRQEQIGRCQRITRLAHLPRFRDQSLQTARDLYINDSIAITVYVLVSIVKKRLNTETSLYTILQILSLTLFLENTARSIS